LERFERLDREEAFERLSNLETLPAV